VFLLPCYFRDDASASWFRNLTTSKHSHIIADGGFKSRWICFLCCSYSNHTLELIHRILQWRCWLMVCLYIVWLDYGEPWTLLSLMLWVDLNSLISPCQLFCYHAMFYMTNSCVRELLTIFGFGNLLSQCQSFILWMMLGAAVWSVLISFRWFDRMISDRSYSFLPFVDTEIWNGLMLLEQLQRIFF